MTTTKRILITPGEPAGIGPDITIQLAQSDWSVELVVIADPALLQARAQMLKLPLNIISCDLQSTPKAHRATTLNVLPVQTTHSVTPGKLDPIHASYVLHTLNLAAELCERQSAAAVVTGPVNKENMNAAGIPFTGHTEFFAQHAKIPHTVMLFVVEKLRVALATTHLPLAQVSAAITKERLRLVLSILQSELQKKFRLAHPRILICGLNPHAGEGGYLGREEIETITPVLNELRQEGFDLIGPLPADTLFTPKHLATTDAVLAMYHDQALPLVKYLGFGNAVNVTLGLPFVRTSVDHGTALDIAGTGQADAGSLKAALALAIQLTK
jgi:4-hydroxythreonine-4-phosphate dehydrogenase